MQELRPDAQPILPNEDAQNVDRLEQPLEDEEDGEQAAEQEPVEERPVISREPRQPRKNASSNPQPAARNPLPATQKDAVTVAVEGILQEGLESLYASLPPQEQAAFRQKGEETAGEIAVLLRATRVRVERVLQLVVRWLKTIPGVNMFFLEQEAKIKTDRMVAMAEERRQE
ncbi:MAG: hypothetical protein RL141_596 [Candidatus Parcubacteria bacterium]|jgi:hypothetical protein